LLNVGKSFALIDFEGEPSRPMGERSLKRSPLVDVAALLRSFDFAAEAALSREAETDRAILRPWAAAWVAQISDTFVRSYFEAIGPTPILPAEAADRATLLELFLVERTLREVAHEATRQSELLSVPLRALAEYLQKLR
jgi:maltose alpha-D-glucosyltransferase/alpha-amylase